MVKLNEKGLAKIKEWERVNNVTVYQTASGRVEVVENNFQKTIFKRSSMYSLYDDIINNRIEW